MKEENEEAFYTEYEVAEFMGITVNTLRKKRSRGLQHPPFKKLGRRVVFPVTEFDAWIDAIPLQGAQYWTRKRGKS